MKGGVLHDITMYRYWFMKVISKMEHFMLIIAGQGTFMHIVLCNYIFTVYRQVHVIWLLYHFRRMFNSGYVRKNFSFISVNNNYLKKMQVVLVTRTECTFLYIQPKQIVESLHNSDKQSLWYSDKQLSHLFSYTRQMKDRSLQINIWRS